MQRRQKVHTRFELDFFSACRTVRRSAPRIFMLRSIFCGICFSLFVNKHAKACSTVMQLLWGRQFACRRLSGGASAAALLLCGTERNRTATVREPFAGDTKLSRRAKKQYNRASVIAQTPVLQQAPLTCSALCRTITTSATRGVQNV